MTLYKHQIEGIKRAIDNNGKYAFFFDCGIGKCLTALKTFEQLKLKDQGLRMLVFAPKSILITSWISDIKQYTDFTVGMLKDTNKGDILLINYELAIAKSGINKIAKLISSGRWMACCDESSRMKNYDSQTTKLLISLKWQFQHRLILSATPCPNTELELWGQIEFISTVLPNKFTQFRNLYFQLSRGNQVMVPNGTMMNRYTMGNLYRTGWKYTITPQKRELLMKMIASCCYWVRKEDVLDLPEKIDEIRQIELSRDELKAYKSMKDDLIAEIGDDIAVASVALAKLMKLRQITSGFAYSLEGKALPIGNSKLNELQALLEEIGNKQVIIFAQFRYEIEQIQSLLPGSVTLYSQTDDKEASINQFKNGEAKYLIGHPKSMAHGLNLQCCQNMIFYSLDYSYEAYEQARNRIHRIGQQGSCTYFHLIAKDTIDEAILKVLQKKIDLQEAIRGIIE